MKRRWLAWHLVAILGCSSEQNASGPSSSGAAGAAGADGGQDGAAGELAIRGGDAGAATAACVDRSAPDCQMKVVAAAVTGGTGLTVIGEDAYWRELGKKTSLMRTSLASDQTMEIAVSADATWITSFYETPFLLNDGTNVFAISTDCCVGVQNALFRYQVSDGTWKYENFSVPQPVAGFLYASGSLVIDFGGRFIYSYSPDDLNQTKTFVTMPNVYVDPIGTDGTAIFMEIKANEMAQVASFDGSMPIPLATAPEEPYGSGRMLAVDETSVYFGAQSKLMSTDRKMPGEPKEIVDLMPNHPLAILVDARAVYWLDEGGIHAIGKPDGKRVDLALFDNSLNPQSPAVKQIDQSASFVVWTGRDGLSKVHK